MPLPLIPIALALVLTACAAKESPECGDDWNGCKDPDDPDLRPEPRAAEGETLYTDGNNVLVADDELEPQAADFYLGALSEYARRILTPLDIDSPFRDKMHMYFIHEGSESSMCPERYGPCYFPGVIEMHPEGSDMAQGDFGWVNHMATMAGRVDDEDRFVAYLSAALRYFTSDASFLLNNGLSAHSSSRLVTRQVNEEDVGDGVAEKIIDNAAIGEGTVVDLSDRQNVFSINAAFAAITDTTAHLAIESDDGEIEGENVWLIRGVPSLIAFYGKSRDVILNVSADGEPRLTAYRRSGELDPWFLFNIGDTYYNYDDSLFNEVVCAPEGTYPAEHIRTEDGPIAVSIPGQLDPYPALEYAEDGSFSVYGDGDYSLNGYCFWDLIEQKHGEAAVAAITRSMYEFSRAHQSCPRPFPLFNSYLEATGESEEEAESFFNLLSIPKENNMHWLGGICQGDE